MTFQAHAIHFKEKALALLGKMQINQATKVLDDAQKKTEDKRGLILETLESLNERLIQFTEYEEQVAKLPDWYKGYLLANKLSIEDIRPEFVYKAMTIRQ